LQLVDLPQPLHPGMIDQVLLGDLPLWQGSGGGESDIAVDWIVAQAFAFKVLHGSGLLCRCWQGTSGETRVGEMGQAVRQFGNFEADASRENEYGNGVTGAIHSAGNSTPDSEERLACCAFCTRGLAWRLVCFV
jgi:hypothetical protein